MDHLTKEKRSWNMRRITATDTAPELLFRRLIHNAGFRYRLHVKTLPGKPDLVLPKYRTVVFVHGCFWHGHEGCRRGNKPKTHKNYWNAKIARNKERDSENKKKLQKSGWWVFTVFSDKI